MNLISSAYEPQRYMMINSLLKEAIINGVATPTDAFFRIVDLYRIRKIKFPIANKCFYLFRPVHRKERVKFGSLSEEFTKSYNVNIEARDINTKKEINDIAKKIGQTLNLVYVKDEPFLPNYFGLSEHQNVFRIFTNGLLALKVLKQNGHLVFYIRNFLTTQPSIQIMYILSNYFKSLVVFRTQIASAHTRECFYIFKNFKGISDEEYKKLETLLDEWNEYDPHHGSRLNLKDKNRNNYKNYMFMNSSNNDTTTFVDGILESKVPSHFANFIHESNIGLNQLYIKKYEQVKELHEYFSTLRPLEVDIASRRILKKNVKASVIWCKNETISVNPLYEKGVELITKTEYLKTIFPHEKDIDLLKLQISPYHSITLFVEKEVNNLFNLMKEKMTIPLHEAVMTEATTYTGRLAIIGTKLFRFVNVVNTSGKSKFDCDIIKNNLKTYKRTNYRLYCDRYSTINHLLFQDVIVFAPPQFNIGVSHKNLYYSGVPIAELLKSAKKRSRLIVILVPKDALQKNVFKNVDLKTFSVYKYLNQLVVFIKGNLHGKSNKKLKQVKIKNSSSR
jgi:hypothetical protein